MDKNWIKVYHTGTGWDETTVYVNPTNETGIICRSKCTHWGYHDDSDWDETEEIVTIEQALEKVYPDKKAIAAIIENTNKDYSEFLKQLEEKHTKPEDKADRPQKSESAPTPQKEPAQPEPVAASPNSSAQAGKKENAETPTMERKIQWNSGCFDEIDLVYDKASNNKATATILSNLEAGALAEAKAYSDKIIVDGRPLTPQQFDALPEETKEQVMAKLSNMGLAAFSSALTDPKITVQLTPDIQKVLNCTAFSILNRLEKLDGAFNVLHPQANLEIQAPLGGKQGLAQIEMLISLLYPWLKVTEVSSNQVASHLAQAQPKPQTPPQQSVAQPTPAPTTPMPAAPVNESKNTQPGFWARLFGKFRQKAEQENKPPVEHPSTPQEKFLNDMWTHSSFQSAFSYAKAEINHVIIKKQFGIKGPSGTELTVLEWEGLSQAQQLQYVLALGNHGIVPSILLCIDFVEIIPYCLAITLLYLAYTGQKETQMLDTGDNSDNTVFKSAVGLLSGCCDKWKCNILTK